jgi:hypothetical protein
VKVAILGSGPAGLMSAAAVLKATTGYRWITIFSNGGKSSLYGAQYLHEPIPHYTNVYRPSAKREINYVLKGSPDEYKRKVYGEDWDGTVSPEDLEETHPAWDIRQTYDALWDEFRYEVVELHMDRAGMRMLTEGRTKYGNFDLVISTIPRPMLCTEGHQFKASYIWAAGEAPDMDINLDRYQCPPETVLCNGEPEPSWYRISNIFGHKTVEWPENHKPPIPSVAYVTKPLQANCDCWPGVLHVGRYGKWQKGVLTHHAYQEVLEHVKTSI